MLSSLLLVGHAWNEDCYGELLLFTKEWQDCGIQMGGNLELLPIRENVLPNCKLPAVVLALNLDLAARYFSSGSDPVSNRVTNSVIV
jgi:hypothetical protein